MRVRTGKAAMRRCATLVSSLAVVALLGSTASAETVTTESVTPEAAGLALAKRLCARCHAVGIEGESPHATALPFRLIGQHYDVWNLAEALAEGIMVGHPDMPEFTLEPSEIEALLSYMESVTASQDATE